MSETAVENTVQKVTVAPFGKRNVNRERIEQEEAELKNIASKEEEPKEEQEVDDASLNAEEKSFKKRYGDLRRHSQQQQLSLQKQIDELKSQLQQSTEKQIKLPKTEAELQEWAKAYPDVAKIIETIAIKKAKEQSEVIEQRLKALDEREHQTAREKAEAELMRIHPDFDQIRDSDEFHSWVEEQPKWVQEALYENDTDARAAARAIDLYKADKNIKAKKPVSKDAAQSIATKSRTSPTETDREGVFYESQVAKMNSYEYEKNQEAIAAALKAGKFVYDLSAGAR